MEYANIIYTVDNGIATIKLNRPKALNALNSEINADIMAAINEVKADPSVRVLIMTGSERAFAAGADVKAWALSPVPTAAPVQPQLSAPQRQSSWSCSPRWFPVSRLTIWVS